MLGELPPTRYARSCLARYYRLDQVLGSIAIDPPKEVDEHERRPMTERAKIPRNLWRLGKCPFVLFREEPIPDSLCHVLLLVESLLLSLQSSQTSMNRWICRSLRRSRERSGSMRCWKFGHRVLPGETSARGERASVVAMTPGANVSASFSSAAYFGLCAASIAVSVAGSATKLA